MLCIIHSLGSRNELIVVPASKHFKKSFRIHYKLVMNNPLLLMKKLVMKRRDFRYEFLTSIHYERLMKTSYRIHITKKLFKKALKTRYEQPPTRNEKTR